MWVKSQPASPATVTACAGAAAPSGDAGRTASAIGTPFLIAFKLPVCAATLVLAAPLAPVPPGLRPPPTMRAGSVTSSARAWRRIAARPNSARRFRVAPSLGRQVVMRIMSPQPFVAVPYVTDHATFSSPVYTNLT